ncbi:hypothetical protein IPZ69_31410 [Streptomyces olivochromogenes]|nr:hypothetical protein [Streptomyces olivochromogenes]
MADQHARASVDLRVESALGRRFPVRGEGQFPVVPHFVGGLQGHVRAAPRHGAPYL